MKNYYAKLVGAFPVHVFALEQDRDLWMDESDAVTVTLDADDARELAEQDEWVICHYPAKTPVEWDDAGLDLYWYPEHADGRYGYQPVADEIEWHRYEQ